MEMFIRSKWRGSGHVEAHHMGSGFFLFTFESEAAKQGVLDDGPWSFSRRPLLLRPWSIGMPIVKPEFSKIPVWVRFPNLPVECWNGEALSMLSSYIGRPLYADRNTSEQIQMEYARVCIEIQVGSQLFDCLPLRTATGLVHRQKCIYEWLPSSCEIFNVFGHCKSSCLEGKKMSPKENSRKGNVEVPKQVQMIEVEPSNLTPQSSPPENITYLRPDTPKVCPEIGETSIKHLSPISEEECVVQGTDLVEVISSALAKSLASNKGKSNGPSAKAKKKQGVQGVAGKKYSKPPESSCRT